MNRAGTFILGIAACGAIATVLNHGRPNAAAATAAPPSTAPTLPPLTVADLRDRGMTGDLGVPMGKIVAIRGTIVDGRTLRFKDAEGRTYADVDRVDGRALAPPVRIEVRSHPFAEVPFTPPAAGRVVNLKGYETGEYTGIVAGFDAPYADTGYFFRNEFTVLR